MTDSLMVRVVRTVYDVRPRRLTASEVIAACDDARSTSVYATLSAISKPGTGPLDRQRNSSGVLDYGIPADFDMQEWALEHNAHSRRQNASATKANTPAGALGESDDEEAAQIIAVLRKIPKRLTGNEIYDGGSFIDRRTMFLTLAQMCEEGGPLERDRTGNGAPFVYGIRRGFAVEEWLADRGESLPPTEPATVPAVVTTSPSKEGVGSAAAASHPIVRMSTTDPKDFERSVPVTEQSDRSSITPRSATPPAISSIAPSQEGAGSVRAAAPPTVRAAVAVPVVEIPAEKWAKETPALGAQVPLNGEAFALAVDLVTVAAANLAVQVRKTLAAEIDLEPELAAAIHNFERADRIYVSTKPGARP